jgi:hypothetical protein
MDGRRRLRSYISVTGQQHGGGEHPNGRIELFFFVKKKKRKKAKPAKRRTKR